VRCPFSRSSSSVAPTWSRNPPVAPQLALGASGVVLVTNSSDDVVPGSFRAAIGEANADASIRAIRFTSGFVIELESPVEFTGDQDLEIAGHGSTLDGSALSGDETSFLATGGGDLEIADVTLQNAPGHGAVIQVPESSEEGTTQSVVLRHVRAIDNEGHGVEINDQEDPDDAGDPDADPQVRGNSNGSDASLEVVVIGSSFVGNGFGALDRDGLRVNEGGLGDLTFSIFDSNADDNGADGVELDERGPGDSVFEIVRSHFSGNGDFDQVAPIDKDDGFDADEVDEGDMIVTVFLSTANDNFEEGFDFNENDAGDQHVTMELSEASGNAEEGVDLEEDDDFEGGGHLVAVLTQVTANDNGGDGGVKIRERGEGDLVGDLDRVTASGNVNDHPNADPEAEPAGVSIREQGDGDLTADVDKATADGNSFEGISLREQDAGVLVGTVAHSQTNDNGAEGIRFREQNGGSLTAAVAHSTVMDNGEAGVRADTSGAGTLALQNVTFAGNGGGDTDGNVPPTP